MIQKDYIIKNPIQVAAAVSGINKLMRDTDYRAALLTVLETGFSELETRTIIESVKRTLPKDLNIVAMSMVAIADIPLNATGIRFNLILTEEASIEMLSLPCKRGEEREAAGRLSGLIESTKDPRAVELFVCSTGLNTTAFLETASHGHEEVGIFGTMTTRRTPGSTSELLVDHFNIFKVGDVYFDNTFCMTQDSVIHEGFIAVLFSGEGLTVQCNYELGWHPIGREMEVEFGDDPILGETVLNRIDGLISVDLFREYLGVEINDFLIANICEFPLMLRRNETDICLIPFDYGKNGEVYISSTIKPDEKLRFGFATRDEVLRSAMRSCEKMDEFEPQALFLVLCGNRINFLKEESSLEWECFRETSPDLSLMHGASEILYQYGRGGVLNSAHVAVGMKEHRGNAQTLSHRTHHDHEKLIADSLHRPDVIPIAERMSVFLDKMTSQLLEVALEAKAANQAKSTFLSNMSHEIRTPINAILGMDEMILRESGEKEIIKYASDIRSAGNSLLGIVNDVLDFSKIEAGKLDILPVEYEFSSVLNDIYNLIKKRASDKGLSIIWNIDPSIPVIMYGDEIRLKQVITNILTNAVKYTREGSITVTVRREDVSDKKDEEETVLSSEMTGKACLRNPVRLFVSVKDTGIGIRKEDMEKLFSAFERVEEKRNRTIEGTGLGLNITARLLGLMNSTLEVSSVYGEGSDFYFTIVQGIVRDEPIGDINSRFLNAEETHVSYRESFRAPDANILVVDDTVMNLEVIAGLLKRTLISIDTATSGAKALELVSGKCYDMIFLDHRMPEMDGIECLHRMKEMPDNKSSSAPVIALTANAVSGAREEYIASGFTDYLTKPIDSGKLEAMLIRYLPAEKVNIIKDEEEPAGDEKNGKLLPEWLFGIDGLNIDAGIINCGSSEDYQKVLVNFYRLIPDNAAEIRGYYEDEDWENYTVKVHALKSSARIIGAEGLSEKARALEQAGDLRDIDTIKKYTEKLLEEYLSLEEELAGLDDTDEELVGIGESEVRDALNSIMDFSDQMDYELVRMVLDSMKGCRLDDGYRELFDRIEVLLSSLDWDGIKAAVNEAVKERNDG